MYYDILYERCPWHTRVALFDDTGRLLSVRIDDQSREFIEGTVVWGRVRKVNAALASAFIDIGDTEDGLLPLKTLPKGVRLTEGEGVVVRITRGHSMGKGARLHGRVLESAPTDSTIKPPYVIKAKPPALARALMDAGDHPVRVWVQDDRFVEEIADRVPEKQIFRLDQHEDFDLDQLLDIQLDSITGDIFSIPGGGYLTIEQTKALAAIDIDTGGATRTGKDSLNMQVNLAATDEIARLCRLLDLGGSIIIDFITPPNKKESERLLNKLKEAFMIRDDHKTEFRPISRFGIAEMNRERAGETLPILLSQPMYVAGRILLEMMRERETQGEIVVEANSMIADILKARLTTNEALATYGRPVRIIANDDLSSTAYRIAQAMSIVSSAQV